MLIEKPANLAGNLSTLEIKRFESGAKEPVKRNRVEGWITVLVSMEKPPSESLTGLDRSERHQLLDQISKKRHDEIVDWIDHQDIESEFKRIGSATLFSTITMICTPLGAKLISKAPGVTRVVAGPQLLLNNQ